MNRGDLPGFYWDQSKQKYFKIQANHLVPQGAKYAKGTVKQEKRTTKKRKIRSDQRIQRERLTVRRAPILTYDAIGGIGLQREHGFHSKASRYSIRADHALVSQLTPERIEVKLPGSSQENRVHDAHYMPESEQMVIASAHAHSGLSAVYACDWKWESTSRDAYIGIPSGGVAAFNSKVATISTTKHVLTPRFMACADQHQAGNVFMGLMPLQNHEVDYTMCSGIYLTVGKRGSSIGDSSIHAETGMAAVIGSCGMFIIDAAANVVNSRPKSHSITEWPQCAPCINWLNPNTVVYGAKAKHGCHSVMLWDIRTPDGKAARFDIRERLTGVFNPARVGNNGYGDDHQILASANYHIDLFDTRMPIMRTGDAPVLSFEHVHGGPRLQGAAYGHLLAAVDADNVMQVYSLRSGSTIGSLMAPAWKPKKFESPVLRQLMWYDDKRNGPILQAVRGNGVIRWAWGDGQAEHEDE